MLTWNTQSPELDPQYHTGRWYLPVVLALWRWRQEKQEFKAMLLYREFEASLGYLSHSLTEGKKTSFY